MTSPPLPPHHYAVNSQIHPGPMPLPPAPVCRCCGQSPAATVTFRTQTAYLFAFSIRSVPGPFCRTCGLAVFRKTTTDTLAKGWWSAFSLLAVNPILIAQNLLAIRTVNRLPHSPPLPHPPLPPGKPIHRRPAAYIALIPVLWLLFFITGMTIHIVT